jgi:hypothetical protein
MTARHAQGLGKIAQVDPNFAGKVVNPIFAKTVEPDWISAVALLNPKRRDGPLRPLPLNTMQSLPDAANAVDRKISRRSFECRFAF